MDAFGEKVYAGDMKLMVGKGVFGYRYRDMINEAGGGWWRVVEGGVGCA